MRVGILGGGQLARMMALAAHNIDIATLAMDESADCPAVRVTEVLAGRFDHRGDLDRLASAASVVTYEFENVPIEAANYLAERLPVYPPPSALETAQDRVVEKTTFRELGIPTPTFEAVSSISELEAAVTRIGLPSVLKTRRLGYDGKGQRVIRTQADVADAWNLLGKSPLILEQFIPFEREGAIIAVRGIDGDHAFYPLVETQHENGILSVALAPAPHWSASLQAEAESYATRLLDHLDYVGVLALELFKHQGRLIGNEFAPRVHNSGHWTIDGAETSQFENHLRAVLHVPLGSTAAIGCAAMVNLIGSIPPVATLLAIPHARVHLYGKRPRAGRKVGHITVRADDPETLQRRLADVRSVVRNVLA